MESFDITIPDVICSWESSCCTSCWMLSQTFLKANIDFIWCKLRCSFYLKIYHKLLLWRYYFYKCGSFENKLNVAQSMLPMKIRQENLRKLWRFLLFINQEFSTSPKIYQDKHPEKNMWFSIIKVTREWKRWNSSWWVFNTRKFKTAQAICRFNLTETNQCKQSLSRIFFLSLPKWVF